MVHEGGWSVMRCDDGRVEAVLLSHLGHLSPDHGQVTDWRLALNGVHRDQHFRGW
jgi:hypothetical protein